MNIQISKKRHIGVCSAPDLSGLSMMYFGFGNDLSLHAYVNASDLRAIAELCIAAADENERNSQPAEVAA